MTDWFTAYIAALTRVTPARCSCRCDWIAEAVSPSSTSYYKLFALPHHCVRAGSPLLAEKRFDRPVVLEAGPFHYVVFVGSLVSQHTKPVAAITIHTLVVKVEDHEQLPAVVCDHLNWGNLCLENCNAKKVQLDVCPWAPCCAGLSYPCLLTLSGLTKPEALLRQPRATCAAGRHGRGDGSTTSTRLHLCHGLRHFVAAAANWPRQPGELGPWWLVWKVPVGPLYGIMRDTVCTGHNLLQ